MQKEKQQITLDYQSGISKLFDSGREFLHARSYQQGKRQKDIAELLEMSASQLSRKLAQVEGDSARFTLDDAEKFMAVTNDFSLIEYFVDKFLANSKENELDQLKMKIKQLESKIKAG